MSLESYMRENGLQYLYKYLKNRDVTLKKEIKVEVSENVKDNIKDEIKQEILNELPREWEICKVSDDYIDNLFSWQK